MRTFFCFELPEQVKLEMARLSSEIESPAYVKWVDAGNLHITAKFLGEVEPKIISTLEKTSREAARGTSPFEITIDKLGAFPEIDFPKVLWLGPKNPPSEITKIYNQLERNLENFGFDPENRSYVPHITLGRAKDRNRKKIKKLGDYLKKVSFEVNWNVTVDHLTLMESQLQPSGPIYEPKFHVDL